MSRNRPGMPPNAPPGPFCLKCHKFIDPRTWKCKNPECPNYGKGWR